MKPKVGFQKKIHAFEKPLVRLTKKKREAQITTIWHERGIIIIDLSLLMKRTVGEYYEQLYANKLENVDNMDQLLEIYKSPKLIEYR